MTSRVAACTARGTGLDYCRIRCADKILRTIRLDKKKKTDPLQVVIAIRALMDFCYWVQAHWIMETDIKLIKSALQEFHLYKHSILNNGLHHGSVS